MYDPPPLNSVAAATLFKKERKKRKKDINIKKKGVGDNIQFLNDCHYKTKNNNDELNLLLASQTVGGLCYIGLQTCKLSSTPVDFLKLSDQSESHVFFAALRVLRSLDRRSVTIMYPESLFSDIFFDALSENEVKIYKKKDFL